jgi:hypothetical protein
MSDPFQSAALQWVADVNKKKEAIGAAALELGYAELTVVTVEGHPGGSPRHPACLVGTRDGASHTLAKWFVYFEHGDNPGGSFVTEIVAPDLNAVLWDR